MAIISLLFVGTLAVSFIFSKGKYDVYAFSTGSPGGRTDSPGDMSNCFACHTGSFNSGNAIVAINSNDLANGYVPGQTYNIQLDVNNTNAAKVGFEVTAEKDADNSKVGTLLLNDANQTQFVNSNAAITHTSAGSVPSSNAKNWSFSWTAPNVAEGDITFYAAFNCANGNGTTTGDEIYTTSFTISENLTSVNENNNKTTLKIYPNPATERFFVWSNHSIQQIEIYGLNGQLVLSTTNTQNSVEVSGLEKGIYLVKVVTDKQVTIKKLIKN